ncbi:uncharacterized protein LOC136082041 isoform X3 [Hydra vulgaris]|uniref:Uncharacterized protein LOC136082041 isoform X3 n=1 Tax=Hydra vulgaris TaxID=6087 RepID=A0ABM4C525_HYDVU
MEEMKQTQKEIQETQRIQTNMLQILLQHYNKSADKTELPDDVVFPMQSMDNFQEIEERLKNNDFANALIGYLSDLGGRDIWETTKRIMKFFMVKNLAILFNMQGTKGKRSFSNKPSRKVLAQGTVTEKMLNNKWENGWEVSETGTVVAQKEIREKNKRKQIVLMQIGLDLITCTCRYILLFRFIVQCSL